MIASIARELHAVAPDLTLEVFARRHRSLSQARRAGYDVVVLCLTGEGRRREKLIGLRCGAPVVLARGLLGQWYRVDPPVWRPTSPRWWARVLFVLLPLLLLYLLIVEAALLRDVVRPWFRRPRRLADPGPIADTRVTFIVPTYNQRALMDFCLPALVAEAGTEHQVIVVDDAGTDDTAEYVRRTYPSVQVVRLQRNEGFAGAVRAGIAASTTPLFALINNDAQVRPGFLAAMVPHFDQPDVFAVCARIELPDGSQVETGRVAAAFSGILEPHHLPPTEGPAPTLYAGGASSIFHRARYDALGGLDTLYHPFYWEDIELGYRAWRVGWRSLFEPQRVGAAPAAGDHRSALRRGLCGSGVSEERAAVRAEERARPQADDAALRLRGGAAGQGGAGRRGDDARGAAAGAAPGAPRAAGAMAGVAARRSLGSGDHGAAGTVAGGDAGGGGAMRILFVSPFLPYPPVAGGHAQIWGWMKRLAASARAGLRWVLRARVGGRERGGGGAAVRGDAGAAAAADAARVQLHSRRCRCG